MINVYVRHAHTHEPFFWGGFALPELVLCMVKKFQAMGLDGFVEIPGPNAFCNTKSFFHNEEFEL